MAAVSEQLHAYDSVLDRMNMQDAQQKKEIIFQRKTREKFGRRDESLVNGRPHHLGSWLAGVITGLGNRRP